MSADRDQVDAIKAHFARKSSAHLREIVETRDPARWSPEAVVAAEEVLQDRQAGSADEPLVPEPDPPPPPAALDPYSVGFMALGMLAVPVLGGVLRVTTYRVDYTGSEDPDLPIPFGRKSAWIAVETCDTEEVAVVLGLRGVRSATWAQGIKAAYESAVYVTPPVAEWTLAVGTALFPPDRVAAFVKPLVERLSQEFGDAQYFCTHEDVGLHVWARARRGRLVRGYGWLGAKELTLWDEGTPTREEYDLGLAPYGRLSLAAGDEGSTAPRRPDDAAVIQLACLWSMDPTSLDGQVKELTPGIVGEVAWAEGGTSSGS
jgi:hypothetical protein